MVFTLVGYTWGGTEQPHKYLNMPRKVAKAQTNSIKFEGGSWLYYEKASNWKFDGDKATHLTFDNQGNLVSALTYQVGFGN
jgi:hypothetical protein